MKRKIIAMFMYSLAVVPFTACNVGAVTCEEGYDVLDAVADTESEPEEESAEESEEELTEDTEGLDEKNDGVEADNSTETTDEIGERPGYDPLDYVKPCSLDTLDVKIPETETVTDEEITERIYQLFKNKEMYRDVEGKAEPGDITNIDYKGEVDGEAFEGGTSEGYDLELGSGTFIDGFEEQLIGCKAGDDVDVNVTFPDDYFSEELKGKDAVFHVKVNSVKRIPDIDNDSVKEASSGAYKTFDEYRQYVKEILEKEHENEAKDSFKSEVYEAIISRCEVTGYPVDVEEYDIKKTYVYYAEQAEANNETLDEMIENQFGSTQDDFADFVKEAVESSLKEEMCFLAVAKDNGMWIEEDEEVIDRLYENAMNSGYSSAEEMVEDMSMDYARAILAFEDILQFLEK